MQLLEESVVGLDDVETSTFAVWGRCPASELQAW